MKTFQEKDGRWFHLLSLVAAVVAVLSARGYAFCSLSDEAVFVRLAQSLLHGRFADQGGVGLPVADPWPGYPLLLSVPVGMLVPQWSVFWLLGALGALAALAGGFALSRRLVGPEAGAAAVLLLAFGPAFGAQAGAALPELPMAAVSAWALSRVDDAPWTRLAVAAAWLSLARPEGAAVAVALAVTLRRRGWRTAALFAAAAFLPLGLWLLRNAIVAPASSYAAHAWSQAAALLAPGYWVEHALAELGSLLGVALLDVPWPAAAVAGGALLAAAAVGFRRSRRRLPAAAEACVVALGGILLLHFLWLPLPARYGLATAPVAWALVAAAFKDRPRLGLAAAAAVLFWLSPGAWRRTRAGLRRPPVTWARTSAWVRERTPPAAVVESFGCAVASLLMQRRAVCPQPAASRREWLAQLAAAGVGYVEVFDFRADSYFPSELLVVARSQQDWARRSGFPLVYRDAEEATQVYRRTAALKP